MYIKRILFSYVFLCCVVKWLCVCELVDFVGHIGAYFYCVVCVLILIDSEVKWRILHCNTMLYTGMYKYVGDECKIYFHAYQEAVGLYYNCLGVIDNNIMYV